MFCSDGEELQEKVGVVKANVVLPREEEKGFANERNLPEKGSTGGEGEEEELESDRGEKK